MLSARLGGASALAATVLVLSSCGESDSANPEPTPQRHESCATANASSDDSVEVMCAYLAAITDETVSIDAICEQYVASTFKSNMANEGASCPGVLALVREDTIEQGGQSYSVEQIWSYGEADRVDVTYPDIGDGLTQIYVLTEEDDRRVIEEVSHIPD